MHRFMHALSSAVSVLLSLLLTHWSQHVSVILRIISRDRCKLSCSCRNVFIAAASLEDGVPGAFIWREKGEGGKGEGGCGREGGRDAV